MENAKVLDFTALKAKKEQKEKENHLDNILDDSTIEENFEEVMKANKAKAEKLAAERAKANQSVKASYRLTK